MRVNEIFYSLQGEGRYTGTAAIFVRLAGCNMRCDFCDTQHEAYVELTEDEIARQTAKYPARHVVVTGGEPTLQLTRSLVDKLHELNSGSCSVKIQRIDELKVVYRGGDMARYEALAATCLVRSLQPCDENDPEKNTANLSAAIEYIKSHPEWRLSLQTHKIINIR